MMLRSGIIGRLEIQYDDQCSVNKESALGAVDSGLIPSGAKPITLKLPIAASLSPSWCGKQIASSY